MTKWYRINGTFPHIEELNVVEETAHTIVYVTARGRKKRTHKARATSLCVPTWMEAKEHLVRKIEASISYQEKHLMMLRHALERAIELKESHDDPHITD